MQPVADYVKETVTTVVEIHRTEPAGDILAFLTGQDEVNLTIKYIHCPHVMSKGGCSMYTNQRKS